MPGPDADLSRNRELWAIVNRAHTDAAALDEWRAGQVRWGLYRIPESRLNVLPALAGRVVIELGAGTSFLSAALARQGARPIAVDPSHDQLLTARRCQEATGIRFPLLEADAAAVPLRSGCADLVISEHGASVWCDPQEWVGEAARLLRPGGALVFLTNSVLSTLCVPDDEGPAQDRLHRAQRGLGRTEWDGGGVEYHPSHGDWIAVLRQHGFSVEALHELYAPDDAVSHPYYQIADPDWGLRWPVEDLWVARHGAGGPAVTRSSGSSDS